MEPAEWEVQEFDEEYGHPIHPWKKSILSAFYRYWLRSPQLTFGQLILEITMNRENWINWDEMEWVQYIQEDMNAQDELMKLYNTNE